MSTDLKAFEDIKTLVLQGRTMEAFAKYYDENVVMQENETSAAIGKTANRQRELDFFSKVVEFRGVKRENVAYGKDVITSE